LPIQVHKLAIEDLVHLLNYNYPRGILPFLGKALGCLQIHLSVMSMQTILHKLIANVSFPIAGSKKKLPQNRQEFIQLLDSELNLTNLCLSSYIEFKRISLVHIFDQMGSQEHEQENLET
jgi:hypothetical protein